MKTFLPLMIAVFLGGCGLPMNLRDPELPPVPTLPAAPQSVATVHGKIAGQVFIVTKGRGTVKLSLTKIRIYDADYIAESRRLVKEHIGAVLQAYAVTGAAFAGPDRSTRGRDVADARANLAWRQLAAPTAEVTTDADGNFAYEGELPSKWALFAQTDRRVFDHTEDYTWLVFEYQVRDKNRIFLNNENEGL